MVHKKRADLWYNFSGCRAVDLEKQLPIVLLPNRETETLATWLKTHPEVEIISRDRASCYSEGAPNAIQVADRWPPWNGIYSRILGMH